MRVFGLIGNPITHSLSSFLFQKKFEREGLKDVVYQLFPIKSISELPFLIEKEKELEGLNVTHPYKEAIFPYLNDLTEEARTIGAVNTVLIKRTEGNPYLIGHNTDCKGFEQLLRQIDTPLPKRALVLGTGGAAKAVVYVLQHHGISVAQVSRSAGRADYVYQEITDDIIKSHRLIINATPVGMGNDSSSCPPLPYPSISAKHILIDLIYSPTFTTFLRKGEEQGAVILNGMSMLNGQAEASWEFWQKER